MLGHFKMKKETNDELADRTALYSIHWCLHDVKTQQQMSMYNQPILYDRPLESDNSSRILTFQGAVPQKKHVSNICKYKMFVVSF